jgi:hypothetical protein
MKPGRSGAPGSERSGKPARALAGLTNFGMADKSMVAASIGMSEGKKSGPTGLGGWLALVGFGLVGSIIRGVVLFVQSFVPVFQNGTWSVITSPGSDAYHPFLAAVLAFELVGSIGFIVAWLALLLLFFKRSRKFPRMFVWVFLLNLPYVLVDVWLGSLVLKAPMIDPNTC